MKKLTKILLINWLYFQKQVIELDDINFLTGKNGAGKSTIIDALQIVFLGELNTRNFNKAASDSSQRTLDGYLRADMDEKNPYSRRGKDFSSYIACEFHDDQNGKQFVTGIVFDCRSDGTRQERYFIYNGVIPEDCFLIERQAMDISALRKYLTQLYGTGATLFDSHTKYRTEMLSRWNVHTEQVCRMLKKAVSFRPITDIQRFITENICDIPDKPDIVAMQQNIRDYKRHEELARRQEEKLEALKTIGSAYRQMQKATDRYREQSFLTLWARKEVTGEEIIKSEHEREEFKSDIVRCEEKEREIGEKQKVLDQRRRELYADREASDVYQEKSRLENHKNALAQEQAVLAGQMRQTALAIKQEAHRLVSLSETIASWPDLDIVAALKEASEGISVQYRPFTGFSMDDFAKPITVFEGAQAAAAMFSGVLRDAAYRLETEVSGIKEKQDEKRAILSNLKRNVKDYPTGLLHLRKRLSEELKTRLGRPVAVDILADLLEIVQGEESWRGAVEGYLNTQKFYLLVPPDAYRDALIIFDRVKYDYRKQSFGLVDIGKLRERENNEPWPDSLAFKVETQSDLARSYIDYLLGRVVCCTHINQLRRHRTAITAEGMLYQGYVARPLRREAMEDAFIGRKAIALRTERIGRELTELGQTLDQLLPLHQELERQKSRETLFSGFFVQNEIRKRLDGYTRGLEISREIDVLEEKQSGLNLMWLADLDNQIKALEQEIETLRTREKEVIKEKSTLEERVRVLDFETLPDLNQKHTEQEDEIEERFSETFIKETGLPRYQQEMERLKRARAIAKNFGDHLQQTLNEQESARSSLRKARTDYVSSFQPCSFSIEAPDNDEYTEEQRRLEESELPAYREKIKRARESAMEQFQNDFLAKLKSSIEQVQDQVRNLNKALRQAQFGTDSYQFRIDRDPDYAGYYDMIMAPELMEGEGGLFALPFQQKYGPMIEELFGRIAASDDKALNARKQSELQKNIELFTDFRTYLRFDLETTDRNGNKQLLSQTLNTKSGGETQTPFYIAVLASFAQLYQVNNASGVANNTVRLVVFDEAFNKMDSDRIIESIRLLRKMHLQAIVCTPPDKLPDIMPMADRTLLVQKNKYQMFVLPYSKEMSEFGA